ncbi:hypothetical protein V6N12_050448 [Hibiscus sabdariffa]|uniref:Uncharacterized protein n=1 Tax=Hibiscus sabdariffa TaxID=183260 RepID=A0ABR2GCQ8_9ROSI
MWEVAVQALQLQVWNSTAGLAVARELVRWSPPDVDWVKINSDSAQHEMDGRQRDKETAGILNCSVRTVHGGRGHVTPIYHDKLTLQQVEKL